MSDIQVLIHQVAHAVVTCPGWPSTLLAYIAEHSYEMWPGDCVTPLLIEYRTFTTLLDRLGRLQHVLVAFVSDRIISDECIAAAFDFAGAFHSFIFLYQTLLRLDIFFHLS